MPSVETKLFGLLHYDESHLIRVRSGLPGLDHTRELLPVSQTTIEPFLFLQSIEEPDLVLLAVPLAVAKQDFELFLTEEQRKEIDYEGPAGKVPRNSPELGAFAFVTVGEDRVPTANLLAPLVICFRNNLAVQALQPVEESYLRYPIEATVAKEAPERLERRETTASRETSASADGPAKTSGLPESSASTERSAPC
jgi:flagellar assembly factor FliW